jgi:hypothetical protein
MGHTLLSPCIILGYLGNLYPRWEQSEVDQKLGACKESGSPEKVHRGSNHER